MEDTIKVKDAALVSFSNEIKALADKRQVLLDLPESNRDQQRLVSIGEDLAYKRKKEDRLTDEIAELKTELKQLKHAKEPPVTTVLPVTAKGILQTSLFLD